MSQSFYSVYGTRLQLVLDDDFAEAYNRALKAFFEAQGAYKKIHGQDWKPSESIFVEWTQKEQDAFNKFAEFMNNYVEFVGDGLDLGYNGQENFPSDYLVKLPDET